MIDAAIILQTLERTAELCGDPSDRVYARLFAVHPEFEPLFFMDTDGAVRGTMMGTALECIIGVAEDQSGAEIQVSAARLQHEGYGVSGDAFDVMFLVMRDVFREVLGEEWTASHDRAWRQLLDRLTAIR